MKIKALLFAAVAMTSLCVSAGTPPETTKMYANDVTITDVTQKAFIYIVVENPGQPDLSNFQFVVDAPEGFQFVQLSQKEAGVGTNGKMRDGLPVGIALENDDHDDFAATANLETGGYVFSSGMANDPLGENTTKEPVFLIAIQPDASKAVAPGEYTFTIKEIAISGGSTDQSLYGELPNSTFKVTVQGEVTAVTDINAKAVAGVKYYNLAGVESNVPFDGVNVVVTTYTDGTKAASKVIK